VDAGADQRLAHGERIGDLSQPTPLPVVRDEDLALRTGQGVERQAKSGVLDALGHALGLVAEDLVEHDAVVEARGAASGPAE
jgi:hypothetical protein